MTGNSYNAYNRTPFLTSRLPVTGGYAPYNFTSASPYYSYNANTYGNYGINGYGINNVESR